MIKTETAKQFDRQGGTHFSRKLRLHDEVPDGAPTAAGHPGRLRWPIGDHPNRNEVSVGWYRPHR